MDDKEFTRLLRRTAAAAAKHSNLVAQCDKVFEDRFGYSPSDVDCDEIIDSLYHGEDKDHPRITATRAAKAMEYAIRQKGL